MKIGNPLQSRNPTTHDRKGRTENQQKGELVHFDVRRFMLACPKWSTYCTKNARRGEKKRRLWNAKRRKLLLLLDMGYVVTTSHRHIFEVCVQFQKPV